MNCSRPGVFVGFLLLFIVGCGFQLRDTVSLPLADSLNTIYIQGVNTQQDLGRELKRRLMSNGVNVVSDYQDGSAVLTILENKVERRVLSVDNDAKVSEYELRGVVRFKVSDGQGQVLSDEQQIEAIRDYQFDQEQVLGKDEERLLLGEQLNQQLVQSILYRLSVLK